jgi:hypothetical protein
MIYQLELPNSISDAYNVFRVSQLKKCLHVPEEQLPMEDLSVQDDLTYAEYPIKILDTLTRVTRNKVIKMCKVQWSHHKEDEATWEREEELRIDFPHLFSSFLLNLEDEIIFKGVGFVILKFVYKEYSEIFSFYVPHLHHEKSIHVIKRI